MQARRRAQPSGTNSPSSYPHPTGGTPYLNVSRCRVVRRSGRYGPVSESLCGPQGTRVIPGGQLKAAHRSAAIACGARPVPFRTRKLSRTAPMVLRGQPVGEQGAADRWTAFALLGARRKGVPSGPSFAMSIGYGAVKAPFLCVIPLCVLLNAQGNLQWLQ